MFLTIRKAARTLDVPERLIRSMGGGIYTDTETDAGACSAFDAAHTGAGGTKSRYRAYDLETIS